MVRHLKRAIARILKDQTGVNSSKNNQQQRQKVGEKYDFKKYQKSCFTFLFIVLSGSIFANKPVVGIGEITSNVGGNPQSFQTMLETAISQTNKFELMERSRMDDLLGEQALSAGGLTQGNGQIGGLSGIDYLVYGSITKLGTKSDAVAFGGIAAGGQKAEMSGYKDS